MDAIPDPPGGRAVEPLQPVEPATPLAPWFGGKKYLAARIIARIEAVPHSCYAEPFCGMGGVFLRRRQRPRAEIVNDINGEIVNLFRIIREHPDEFASQFDWIVASRREFRRLLDIQPETLTDIQRAARFAALQRLRFSGVPETTGMNMTAYHPARLTAHRMRRLITAAHRRLQGVHIECLDWAVFLERYDREFVLFYIDPPYWGHETDYGRGLFKQGDFARMVGMLAKLKGRFILSLNDTPETRTLFKGFRIEAVTTRYSANAKATRRAGELIISG